MTRGGFIRLCFKALLAVCLFPFRALALTSSARIRPVADMTPKVMSFRQVPLPITPTREFYVEDISGPPAPIEGGIAKWRLQITGDIEHPLSLGYQDLKNLPQTERIITLNCIGNPIGGRAIGNARWKGIALTTLIEHANPSLFSRRLVLKGADGYHETIPVSLARQKGSILALEMNGKPLNRDHGFPARVLVPGLYGIKQVKWLHSIEFAKDDVPGYWGKRGWDRDAKVKIFSRIDQPTEGEWLSAGTTKIKGIAFAGDRGVDYVQVSLDGERSWSLAKLEKPLSDYSWVFWSHAVNFTRPGNYQIAVRAADGFSGRQTDTARDPFLRCLRNPSHQHHRALIQIIFIFQIVRVFS